MQGAVRALVPYLNTLRWVFIAVALGGIAVSTRGSTIGSEAGDDRRPSGPARCGAVQPRRSAGHSPGRSHPPAPSRPPPLRRAARPAGERLETVARTNDVQRKPARHVVSKTMLPIAPRPRHHAELHFRSSRVLDLI
jgi:hypothetical protein